MPVYSARDHPVNQGDIFAAVPFPVPMPGGPHMGMVIAHDCDVDKYVRPRKPLGEGIRINYAITMAVVHPVADLVNGRDGDVRADRVARYVHLPAEDDVPELCVDLSTEQPVRMIELLQCDRIRSVSTETKNKLWWKMIRFRLGEHYRSILQGEIPPDAA